MKIINKIIFLSIICLSPILGFAQADTPKIPAELREFIENGATAIALQTADLNGDGAADYILVTEKIQAEATGSDDKRTLSIIIREAGGKFRLAKSNQEVVYCRSCGGVMGDPFADLAVRRNSFTVSNYGGSNWRWGVSYQFNYSRIDKTWQLVRVEEENFNALNPEKGKTTILLPKNFGKIDIADFDPDKIRKSK